MTLIRTTILLGAAALILGAAACGTDQAAETSSPPAAEATESDTGAPCSTDEEYRLGRPGETPSPAATSPVPDVRGLGLPLALCRILAASLRVEIGANPLRTPHSEGDRLETLAVQAVTPEPGTELLPGSTVEVVELTSALPSLPPVPESHPESVEMPHVVGLPYADAVAAIDALGGIVPIVDLSPFPPLSAAASVQGLNGYVVVAQEPAPGSLLPYMTNNPSTSTVRLTLSSSPSAG